MGGPIGLDACNARFFRKECTMSTEKPIASPSSSSRRGFLAASAAVGAFGALSTPLALATGTAVIRPFRINIPQEALIDLRRRVLATPWPDQETVTDASQGVQL